MMVMEDRRCDFENSFKVADLRENFYSGYVPASESRLFPPDLVSPFEVGYYRSQEAIRWLETAMYCSDDGDRPRIYSFGRIWREFGDAGALFRWVGVSDKSSFVKPPQLFEVRVGFVGRESWLECRIRHELNRLLIHKYLMVVLWIGSGQSRSMFEGQSLEVDVGDGNVDWSSFPESSRYKSGLVVDWSWKFTLVPNQLSWGNEIVEKRWVDWKTKLAKAKLMAAVYGGRRCSRDESEAERDGCPENKTQPRQRSEDEPWLMSEK